MRCTWTNVTERGILVSNFGMTCNSLCELHTLDRLRHVSALPEKRLRRRDVLRYETQLPCIRKSTFRWILSQFLITSFHRLPRSIVTSIWDGFSFLPISLFQHSHSIFVIIRFRPFRRLFINLTVCEWALLPKPTTTFGLVVPAFWRVPFFTKWVIASSSKVILARPSWHSTAGTYLWDFGSSMVFAHSAAWKNSETDLMVNFSHAYSYRGGNCNCFLSHIARWFPIANNLQEFFVHAVLFPDSWTRRSPHTTFAVMRPDHPPGDDIFLNAAELKRRFQSHLITQQSPRVWTSQYQPRNDATIRYLESSAAQRHHTQIKMRDKNKTNSRSTSVRSIITHIPWDQAIKSTSRPFQRLMEFLGAPKWTACACSADFRALQNTSTPDIHDCAASMHLANETRVSFEQKDDARAYTHEGTPAVTRAPLKTVCGDSQHKTSFKSNEPLGWSCWPPQPAGPRDAAQLTSTGWSANRTCHPAQKSQDRSRARYNSLKRHAHGEV